ncbi:hypothetical protein HYH03_006963 [Edaphochlamys debaryana]|uniref:Rhodanese domain-containing protein n=1 Tax=Edaphochlamys debaryana TaxID=47281 RepID=A0A835Y318_9CHLO|nr:hypothetical protein HYH03_006963 [Edaphochlamys debaryana]|eukprot:KAG2495031.1 hypothetical protein HYH03_006963 [Edaphochlamys debaryana]
MGTDSEQLVAPELARVDATTVAGLLKSGGKPGSVIVDVRDPEEVATGSIKASVNVPSAVFKNPDPAQLDAVIKEQLGDAKEIIVHCHLSKIRGPTCAKSLADRLKALGVEGTEVKVLAGGIVDFMEGHKDDSSIVKLPESGWNPDPKH